MQHTSVHNSSGISFSRGVGLDGVERESGVCALERSRVSTAGRYEHSLRLDILNRRLGNGQWSVSNTNWESVTGRRQGRVYIIQGEGRRDPREPRTGDQVTVRQWSVHPTAQGVLN